jgi:hypothetical protein
MRETPVEFEINSEVRYPCDDLRGYRFHTGATLRPLAPEESCPILFRDVGLVGMMLFLKGELQRLAGPLSPITYMRTEEYVEPYSDYEQIGRLVFLRPLELQPWHSGVPHIYVARADRMAGLTRIGFVPGHVSLAEAAELLTDVRITCELREVFAGKLYDDIWAVTLRRLEALAQELKESEVRAEPLRRWLQSGDHRKTDFAREWLNRYEISEHDLCAAYHHLPRERRAYLNGVLKRLPRIE